MDLLAKVSHTTEPTTAYLQVASRRVATLNKFIFAFLIYQVKTALYFRAQTKLSTQRV